MGAEIISKYKVVENTRKKVSLLKFPSGKANFDVVRVFLKPNHNYIKVECKFPELNGYAPKSKHSSDAATKSIFFGGFGSKPKKKTYFSHVLHSEEQIVVHEIIEVFYLQPIFESSGDIVESALSMGVQFMKIENKEELEHRKKNINYLLKVYNKEDFIKMEYSIKEEGIQVEDLEPFSAETHIKYRKSILEEVERIRKIIFNARIVNLGELSKVTTDQEGLKKVLAEMTTPFRGRFLLKNEFYEKRCQVLRKRLLDQFSCRDCVLLEEIRNITQDCNFLVNELCNKTEGGYGLKGYDEKLGLEDGSFEVSDAGTKIQNLLGSDQMASVEKIVLLSGLEKADVVNALLEGPFIKLSNNCYANISSGTGALRALVLDLFSKKQSVRKSEVLRAVKESLGEQVTMEDVLDIAEKFCNRKGASWILRHEI